LLANNAKLLLNAAFASKLAPTTVISWILEILCDRPLAVEQAVYDASHSCYIQVSAQEGVDSVSYVGRVLDGVAEQGLDIGLPGQPEFDLAQLLAG